MRIKFGVTSSNNRKINLYRKHREIKLQALTKMVATYLCKDIQSYNMQYHVCHGEGNSLLGRFLLYVTGPAKIGNVGKNTPQHVTSHISVLE